MGISIIAQHWLDAVVHGLDYMQHVLVSSNPTSLCLTAPHLYVLLLILQETKL